MTGRVFNFFSILLIFSLSLVPLVFSDSIIGCGGFVNISRNLAIATQGTSFSIDYSHIKINLYTKDGLLKDQTECAPNGYYFYPLYDFGSFDLRVQGPPGWYFEPSSFPISIRDGDQCNNGEDINFSVTGFSLDGVVEESSTCKKSSKVNPDKLSIQLFQQNQLLDQQLFERDTNSGGFRFRFGPVIPGVYQLKVHEPRWVFHSSETEVTINNGNSNVPAGGLVISAYQVTGRVTSSEEGLGDVEFTLYENGKNNVIVGEAKSHSNGSFVISNVPCGEYLLYSKYSRGNTRFDVTPRESRIFVSFGGLNIDEAFRVFGFTAKGRVVDENGNGIANVEIRFNGKNHAVTGQDGYYYAEAIETGEYDIEASLEDVVFTKINKAKLTPTQTAIPDLIAKGYSLCGRVSVPQPPSGVSAARKLKITNIETSTREFTQTTNTGEYCFVVPSGKYKVEVELSREESLAGLEFKQREKEIQISGQPQKNVDFHQRIVSISGRVVCLDEKCDPSVSVKLSSSLSSGRQITPVTTALTESQYFVFENLLPGRYKLKVEREGWIWENEEIEIDAPSSISGDGTSTRSGVSSTSSSGSLGGTQVEFFQKGYVAHCYLKSPLGISGEVIPLSPSIRPFTVQLAPGNNRIALPKPGKYIIKPQGAFKFDKEEYHYDTSEPSPIELAASRILLTGTLLPKKGTPPLSSFPAGTLSVRIEVEENGTTKESDEIEVKCNVEEGNEKCEYRYWAPFPANLKLRGISKTLLVNPSSQDFIVGKSPSHPSLQPFIFQEGVYLKGKVEPPTEGTKISVFIEHTNEFVTQVLTQQDGSYSLGPLDEDQKYYLKAEKEGYQYVEKDDKTGFRGLELGQLLVEVRDQQGQALSGALLSLTGGKDAYRSNKPTAANGTVSFIGLHPGRYFLRVFLKEYVFDPSSVSLDLDEGKNQTLVLLARRIAFSCYGSVRYLNGEPEKFVTVEAISSNGDREESQTDKNGDFRIRGLKPGFGYNVRVKDLDNAKIERSTPLTVAIQNVSDSDILSADFVVFRKPTKYSVSGSVIAPSDIGVDSASVELLVGEEDTPVKTVKAYPANYFEFSGLNPNETYFLRVVSSLSTKTYLVEKKKIPLDLVNATSFQIVMDLPLEVSQIRFEHDTATNSSAGIFFFLLVGLIFVFRKQLVERFEDIVNIKQSQRAGASKVTGSQTRTKKSKNGNKTKNT